MGSTFPLIGCFTLLLVLRESFGSVEMFSCVFDDPNSLERRQAFPPVPKFNDFNNENALQFESLQDYLKFRNTITKMYPASNNGSIYTNYLSNYLRFYKTYRAVKDCPQYTDFQSFYNIYPVNFRSKYERSKYEPGSNVIRLMKDIAKLYPAVARAGYFISRNYVEKPNVLKTLNPTSKNLPEWFHHEQIAGIIKYRKYNKSYYMFPPKYAYILLDPDIGASQPIFFDEGEYFHFYHHGIVFKSLNSITHEPSNFMIATIPEVGYSVHPSDPDQTLLSRTTYVYFIRQAYCSFVETTIKPNLLKFGHIRKKIQGPTTIVKITTNVGRDEELPLHETLPYNNFQLFYYGHLKMMFKFPLTKQEIAGKIKANILVLDEICETLGLEVTLRCVVDYFCQSYWQDKIELLQEIWADNDFHIQSQLTLKTLRGSKSNGSLPGLPGEKHLSNIASISILGGSFPVEEKPFAAVPREQVPVINKKGRLEPTEQIPDPAVDDLEEIVPPHALVDDNPDLIPRFGTQEVGGNAKRGVLESLVKFYRCTSHGYQYANSRKATSQVMALP